MMEASWRNRDGLFGSKFGIPCFGSMSLVPSLKRSAARGIIITWDRIIREMTAKLQL